MAGSDETWRMLGTDGVTDEATECPIDPCPWCRLSLPHNADRDQILRDWHVRQEDYFYTWQRTYRLWFMDMLAVNHCLNLPGAATYHEPTYTPAMVGSGLMPVPGPPPMPTPEDARPAAAAAAAEQTQLALPKGPPPTPAPQPAAAAAAAEEEDQWVEWMARRANGMNVLGKWQYRGGKKMVWRDLDARTSTMVENAYYLEEATVDYEIGEWSYTIHFDRGVQRSHKTGQERAVRRLVQRRT